MTDMMLNELFDYAVKIRRRLHAYPEVGFELDRTISLVAGELDKMGIPYTDRYGTCSLVAESLVCTAVIIWGCEKQIVRKSSGA